MSISDFFSNDLQTSDNHKNPDLVTHYYKSDYRKIEETVLSVAKKLGFEVKEVNEDYKEIRIEKRAQEIIINIFTISYFEQAVDLKVNTSYILACGRGVKLVKTFYQELDRLATVLKKG